MTKSSIPNKFRELHAYLVSSEINNNARYKMRLNDSLESLDRKAASILSYSTEDLSLKIAVSYWNEERGEILKSIDEYISIPFKERRDHYFYCLASAYWYLWSRGEIEHEKVTLLVKNINEQVIQTGLLPALVKHQENNKRGRPVSGGFNSLLTLMLYLKCGKNLSNAGKIYADVNSTGVDKNGVKNRIKQVVGDDFKSINNIDHRFYLHTDRAYQHFNSQLKLVEQGFIEETDTFMDYEKIYKALQKHTNLD